MINLNLHIYNPWIKENFVNLFCRSGKITKNKAWEFEITKYTLTLFEVSLSLTTKQDHAGLQVSLGLFGFTVQLRIYDGRHWNYETNTWEVYEGE